MTRPTAYKVVYELVNEALTKKARETEPHVLAVTEGYHKIVEADSVWKALVVFGGAISGKLSLGDTRVVTAPGYHWRADTEFTIVSVEPYRE